MNVTPRLRRLLADHEQVTAALASHSRIRLLQTEGTPPELYTIEFEVAGLVPDAADGFFPGNRHRAQIQLSLDYPRRPPFCRMLTPVFHPNIDPQKICIGDHWSAGQSLLDLIVRIGQMIAYQSYNVKSPLNAKAAAWAEQHEAELPLEKIDLTPGT
jgi:ubiquitin-protein ligase